MCYEGKCEVCGKSNISAITAIPELGYDLCIDCLKKFANEVMKKEPRDTVMKIDPKGYELLARMLGIPEEQWVTKGVENPTEAFWDGIICMVNKEAYMNFFKKEGR